MQGDPLSIIVFNATLEEVSKTLILCWTGKGINIGGKRLSYLRFVDDAVLVSSIKRGTKLDEPNTVSCINRSKTKLMMNATEHKTLVFCLCVMFITTYI